MKMNKKYVEHHKVALICTAITVPIFLGLLVTGIITHTPKEPLGGWLYGAIVFVIPTLMSILELDHGCGTYGECIGDERMFQED